MMRFSKKRITRNFRGVPSVSLIIYVVSLRTVLINFFCLFLSLFHLNFLFSVERRKLETIDAALMKTRLLTVVFPSHLPSWLSWRTRVVLLDFSFLLWLFCWPALIWPKQEGKPLSFLIMPTQKRHIPSFLTLWKVRPNFICKQGFLTKTYFGSVKNVGFWAQRGEVYTMGTLDCFIF